MGPTKDEPLVYLENVLRSRIQALKIIYFPYYLVILRLKLEFFFPDVVINLKTKPSSNKKMNISL